MECGSYGKIKPLEHAMKVVERIFENIIRQHSDNDMQFGFTKGNGTTDAIFIVRQMLKEKSSSEKSDKMGSAYCVNWELKNG